MFGCGEVYAKKCSKCEQYKFSDEFTKSSKDCKICKNKKYKIWRENRIEPTERKCSRCKENKSIDNFSKCKSWCKSCRKNDYDNRDKESHRKYNQKRWIQNKDKESEQLKRKLYRQTPEYKHRKIIFTRYELG